MAAVILEPSGASWGQVPLPEGFLAGLREVTRKHGVVLIFDEVITGFRWSPGGAQARFGVTPDMCVLAKIVAGGLPGGAVAGRADIMDQLDAAAAKSAKREKIGHQGTFNANPLCAAAAVATLSIVESEDVCAKAERTAAEIRDGLRRILVEEQIPWGVYGEASSFLIFQNPNRLADRPGRRSIRASSASRASRARAIPTSPIACASPCSPTASTSWARRAAWCRRRTGPREVAHTLEAFRTAVRWLKAEGDV